MNINRVIYIYKIYKGLLKYISTISIILPAHIRLHVLLTHWFHLYIALDVNVFQNIRVRVLGGKKFLSRDTKMLVGEMKDNFVLVDLETVMLGSYR